MKTISRRIMSVLLVMVMALSMCLMAVPVRAAGADPYTTLITQLKLGTYTCGTTGKPYDFASNRYALSGGGYKLYAELWNLGSLNGGTASQGVNLFTEDFEKLKSGAKQDFLKDVFTLANAIATDSANNVSTLTGADKASLPTDDTVNDMMQVLQQQSGLGATLLATLLQNTKPDYVSANRLYEPFSGVVGTILGVISIILMAALGVTMALDLAYITIPAFQMSLGGSEATDGNGGKGKGIGGIISQEAKKAVQAADGGAGGQAGSGEYRAAVGIYFKYRWKGLVLLGLCLLYLVQGQIYSFVAWFIDLFSGFLGF